jgi:hypothetical protein
MCNKWTLAQMLGKISKDDRNYFARYLSITKPKGDHIFEFLIYGIDEPGTFVKMLEIFTRHKIDIRSVTASPDQTDEDHFFVSNVFCDMSKSDCITDSIISELRKLPFVRKVLCADMKMRLFDRFLFPTLIMNNNRVILMRVEALLRMEKSLFEKMGSVGAAMMFDQGKIYGEDALKQYRLALPGASTEVLVENITDGLRATGWGLFRFRNMGDRFEVTVSDPPILEDCDYRENRFYYGATARMLEELYGMELGLEKSNLDLKNKKLTFQLKRIVKKI